MNLLQLFKTYNSQIERHKKAIKYFEMNPDKVDAHINNYREIVNELCQLRVEIAKHAYVMSSDEVLEGFRQIKALEADK